MIRMYLGHVAARLSYVAVDAPRELRSSIDGIEDVLYHAPLTDDLRAILEGNRDACRARLAELAS